MIVEKDALLADELKHQLLACSGKNIRRVILYGSRAEGTYADDSDFDLLIVESDPVSTQEETRKLRDSVTRNDYSIDIHVMGEQEFEETKHVIGGLAYPAHKYGIVLYENA